MPVGPTTTMAYSEEAHNFGNIKQDTEKGKQQLKEFGIAPPEKSSVDKSSITGDAKFIGCPQCNSENTEMISQFGSTACKALYRCKDCLEPFDYFKCL